MEGWQERAGLKTQHQLQAAQASVRASQEPGPDFPRASTTDLRLQGQQHTWEEHARSPVHPAPMSWTKLGNCGGHSEPAV